MIEHPHPYPPEYDEEHATGIEVPNMPDWISAFFWLESGQVVAQLAAADVTRDVAIVAADSGDDDTDMAAAVAACVTWLASIDALDARIGAAQAAANKKPMPPHWWEELEMQLVEIFGMVPTKEDNLYTDDSEAGDTYVEWDDDEQAYVSRAYAFDFGRDEDGFFVKAGTWDGDDWDYSYHYEDDAVEVFRLMDTDHYFANWAAYFLWQFKTDDDPVETWYSKSTDAALLEAIEDNLGYIARNS